MGTMSKSLREKRPLFALFEHSCQMEKRGSCEHETFTRLQRCTDLSVSSYANENVI